MRLRYALLSVSTILLLLAGIRCGDEGPTGKSREVRDGRIMFRNDTTNAEVETEYFNEDLQETIKALIPAGQTKDISQAVLKGGTDVLVTFCMMTGNYRVCQEVKVTVDGTRTIQLVSFAYQGEIVYEVI